MLDILKMLITLTISLSSDNYYFVSCFNLDFHSSFVTTILSGLFSHDNAPFNMLPGWRGQPTGFWHSTKILCQKSSPQAENACQNPVGQMMPGNAMACVFVRGSLGMSKLPSQNAHPGVDAKYQNPVGCPHPLGEHIEWYIIKDDL
jgi:hypothetical protein